MEDRRRQHDLAVVRAKEEALNIVNGGGGGMEEDDSGVSSLRESLESLVRAVEKGEEGEFTLFPDMPFLKAKWYQPPGEVVKSVKSLNTVVTNFTSDDAEHLAQELQDRCGKFFSFLFIFFFFSLSLFLLPPFSCVLSFSFFTGIFN